MKRVGILLILLLAFCGVANSAYLTQHEANGTPLLCDVKGLSGCNIVASSPYAHIFGISLAEYGLAFYGLLFVLAACELLAYSRPLRRTIQGIAFFGIIASIYFVILQVFVISALCIYCMASAVLALLIFLSAYFIEPVRRRATAIILPPPPHHPFEFPSSKPPLSMPPSA